MARFEITPYQGAPVENTKLDFHGLYLRQIFSGPEKNQLTTEDGIGPSDFGQTVVNNWAIYAGADHSANLVAHAQGLRTKAGGNWYNSFIMVFVVDRFKGSTLEVMGATIEGEGDWAIVGGTGLFEMARGVIRTKVHEKIATGEVIELSLEAFCRSKMQPSPAPANILPPPSSANILPPTPRKEGPWGWKGNILHDITPYVARRLESITIFFNLAICAIDFSYTDKDGQKRSTGPWGYSGANSQTLQLGPLEFVHGIRGTYGFSYGDPVGDRKLMWSLELFTNLRSFGPFGSPERGDFFSHDVPHNNKIVGFFGSSESDLGFLGIGVYTVQDTTL